MRSRIIPALLCATIAAMPACKGDSQFGSSNSGDVRYDPPNTEFAAGLGLTPPPPVTREQAMDIAAAAAGGTAVGSDQETEGGELLYEVQVETAAGRKEVEVRASDGGVVEIESGDDD